MLRISGQQRNANQNHSEISPQRLLEILLPKRQEIMSVGKDVEKREPCTLGMETGAATMKKQYGYGGSSKTLKELPYDPVVLLLGIYAKEMKILTWKDTCTLLSIAALFTVAKVWKQPKFPPIDE